MADKKISALIGASTPLAGTEVLPIVQSGATVKVAVSDLTAGRAISATQLTLTTGNLIVANGQGVDFSATPNTGTSELFADYEEGTWTPNFYGWTGTYAIQSGRYTKIGRIITLQAVLTTNGGTGTFSQTYPNIQGLPYSIAYIGSGIYGQWVGANGFTVGVNYVSGGTFDYGSSTEFFVNLTGTNSTGVGNLTYTMLSNATNVSMKITSVYSV